MKITEFKGGDALDLIADIIEPAATISNDKKFVEMVRGKANKISIATYVLRHHKKPLLEILATLNGESVENYSPNPAEIIKQLIDLFNDKELIGLFTSQSQIKE